MDRLVTIALIEGDRSGVVPLPEDLPLLEQVAGTPSVKQRLGQAAALTLAFTAGTPAAANVEVNGLMLLRMRRILRLTFASGAQEEYRILDVKRDLTGESSVQVAAESLWWSDLAALYPRRTLVTGYADPAVSLTGQTAAEAWAALLSADLGCPALYAAGTVAAALADVVVTLDASGEVTTLQALRSIADQAGGEIEVRYVEADDTYEIDLVEEAGWTDGEIAAGEADPDLRPVVLGPDGGGRRSASRTSDGRGFFSRIIPLARVEQSVVTMAQARHAAVSHTYDAGTDRTAIVLEADTTLPGTAGRPSWPVGLYLESGGVTWLIVDVDGDAVYVAGDVTGSAATHYRIALNADGDDLVFIADPDAEEWAGRAEQARSFDVPPYPNLLADAGVSADLSGWDAGLPEGTALVGAPTVTQIDGDARFVRHGTRSAKVEADAGEGIESVDVLLAPTAASPWQSVYVNVRVESGRVAIELVDADGTVHPEGQRAGSNADRLEAVAIEGITAAAGNARLRVVAEEDGTVFYLDAWTLTPSPTAWQFAPAMGPRALYAEGLKALRDEGGVQPDRYQGVTIDESHFNGALAEIRLGSRVRLRDAYNPATDSYDVDVAARVEEIQYTIDPIDGAVMKTFILSNLRKSFTNLFNAALRRARLWRVPNEDRAAVMLSATMLGESGDNATVRLSARPMKRGPYELVERIFDGTTVTSSVIAELGTFEDDRLVARPVDGGGWVEYEAVQLGVSMSPAVRLPLTRRPPALAVVKTNDDSSGVSRIVTFDVTLGRVPEPGLVLTVEVVEGPFDTSLVEGEWSVLLGFTNSNATEYTFVFNTVLGQEVSVYITLYNGTRIERRFIG